LELKSATGTETPNELSILNVGRSSLFSSLERSNEKRSDLVPGVRQIILSIAFFTFAVIESIMHLRNQVKVQDQKGARF
jgi:hypothetical protein